MKFITRIAFDFQNKRVKPTHYTLQYCPYMGFSLTFPRQWELQGSNYPIAFDVHICFYNQI